MKPHGWRAAVGLAALVAVGGGGVAFGVLATRDGGGDDPQSRQLVETPGTSVVASASSVSPLVTDERQRTNSDTSAGAASGEAPVEPVATATSNSGSPNATTIGSTANRETLVTQPSTSPTSVAQAQATASETTTIGSSVGGGSIEMTTFGAGGTHVFLVGAIHGNAREMSLVASQVGTLLDAGAEINPALTLHVITQLNPDGAATDSRENANGVDLNRNFPASNFVGSPEHGQAPLSEPESRALASIVDQLSPTMIIVGLHTRFDPFVNYDGPDATKGARLASLLGFQYSSSESSPPTPGSIGNWYGRDRGRDAVFVALNASSDVNATAEGLLEFLSG
jgi:hypothetical protein